MILSVFSSETARQPPSPWRSSPRASLDQARHQATPPASLASTGKPPARVQLQSACFLYSKDTMNTSYATDGDVHVMLLGEVASWPGIDAVSSNHNAFIRGENPLEPDDAHWLLDFYSIIRLECLDSQSPRAPIRTFDTTGSQSDEILDMALESLNDIRGSFAFVIYDQAHHRVLAARDRDGIIPLYWGTDADGQLLFGSNSADLAGCEPTATLFPSGSLFSSTPNPTSPGKNGWVMGHESMPGQLLSYLRAETDPLHYRGMKAIPRITSRGILCGEIFKVASNPDLARPVLHF